MIRLPTTCALALSPAPALAHRGHLADASGHDHWIALGAIGLAAAGGAALLAGKGKSAPEPEDAEDETAKAEGGEALA